MGQAAAVFVAARAACPERDRNQQLPAAALGGDRSEPVSRKAVPSPGSSARWHEGDDGTRAMSALGWHVEGGGTALPAASHPANLPPGSCSRQGAGGA